MYVAFLSIFENLETITLLTVKRKFPLIMCVSFDSYRTSFHRFCFCPIEFCVCDLVTLTVPMSHLRDFIMSLTLVSVKGYIVAALRGFICVPRGFLFPKLVSLVEFVFQGDFFFLNLLV